MLIVLGGLPGTGKTTLARALAARLKATYLRIDTIEQSLHRLDGRQISSEGYEVAYAIAEDNLHTGNIVICDAVNAMPVTRTAWRDIAARTGSAIVEIEVLCSDRQKHQHRVETREADIPGHQMPTWQDVLNLEYLPWETKHFTIDTALQPADNALADLIGKLTPFID